MAGICAIAGGNYLDSILQLLAQAGAPKVINVLKNRESQDRCEKRVGYQDRCAQLGVELEQGPYYPEHTDCEQVTHGRGGF